MYYSQTKFVVIHGVFFFELVSRIDMNVYYRHNVTYNLDVFLLADRDTSNYTKL